MRQKLKQILLTQYIGAIVTALVAVQLLQKLTDVLAAMVWHLAAVWRTPPGESVDLLDRSFRWESIIYALVIASLNAAVIYGLIKWLFLDRQTQTSGQGAETAPPATELKS